jgi:uncharacterized membrane protein
MKYLINPGRCLFATAITGFGIINFVTGNFPTAFLPVFNSVWLKILLVYLTGIIFIIAGISLMVEKYSKAAATVIAILFFLNFLYPQLTTSLLNISNPNQWTITLEILAMGSGAFILAAFLKDGFIKPIISPARLMKISHFARYSFAVALLGFGILHYIYADFIATLIPAWMPAHAFLNYIVMFGFFATAISIIINIQTRWATALLGIMFFIWIVALHLPRAFGNPSKEAEWSSLLIALAMSGAGFIIAAAGSPKDNVL